VPAELEALNGASIGQSSLLLLALGFLLAGALLLLLWWTGYWLSNKSTQSSPYGQGSLRRADELSFSASMHLQNFLNGLEDDCEALIDVSRSAICARTGRIFPDVINRWGELSLDWRFLRRCYDKPLVSWGSLSSDAQQHLRARHRSLEGFQTELSSQRARPQDVEYELAVLKPGPLYVDPKTAVVVGWKMVPCTDLEVLVRQKPRL
jgi:hypothetical protein